MKIAIFAEGSYPYVSGGVSGWLQMLLTGLKEKEFVLYTIIPDEEGRGKFRYRMPPNVSQLRESVLLENEAGGFRRKKVRLTAEVRCSLHTLLFGEDVEWESLFHFFDEADITVDELLMSGEFLSLVQELYREKYPNCVFTDFLWSLRSLYEPLFRIMQTPVEEADCYHSICTGYAGIVACKAKCFYKKPLLLTEHGIYTREREEEIIKSEHAKGIYKNLWIDYFYTLSQCIYGYADQVISLFGQAREIQVEIGCPRQKTMVISNGVYSETMEDLPQKEEKDVINVGAVLRIVPIKDIKTLLLAFAIAKGAEPALHLYLMGPTDENEQYYSECREMVERMRIPDVVFTGNINVRDYVGKMDMIILTSISEGQPLSILEAMAAGKPCIATDVGGCRELLEGTREDRFGASGLVIPVMNADKAAQAVLTLARDSALREKMGRAGKARVAKYYQNDEVLRKYRELYGYWCGKEEEDGGNRI